MWRTMGQERAVTVLKKSLENGQLSHAYLFTGPAGVGKMTLAIDLARAVNCPAAQPPCGECSSCKKILEGRHADVQVLKLNRDDDGENARNQTEIGVEQVKQLQHSASLPPFEGRCRVFIIDGAELMSAEAANRLLKTLEEPESGVVFILLAADGAGVIETIASRCQHVELWPAAIEKVEEELVRSGVGKEKAGVLARLSRGCFGWALLAAGDDDFLAQHSLKRDVIFDIIYSNVEKRFGHAERMAAAFLQRRQAVLDELDLWLGVWRDILLLQLGCRQGVINIDAEDRLGALAKDFSLTQIKTAAEAIREARARLNVNASPRLVLDIMMLDLPQGKGDSVAGA